MPLPRNVALLALASFLADVSGEMLMAVFPFLLVAQGATGVGLGLVGGLADAVGHLAKPLFGRLSDRARRRKPLVVWGYVTASASRVGIALAGAWPVSLAFRVADRIGKGMRTAPRDALLAESVDPRTRGRAFGIHRAADTAGAFVGAGLALAGLALLDAPPSEIVLVGAFLGLLTVVPLAFVRDAPGVVEGKDLAEPVSPHYLAFLAVAGVHALGAVSYLFFLLRVSPAVGGPAGAVALYLLFNAVYAAGAYPAGVLADRWGRPPILAAGFAFVALASALLVPAPTPVTATASFLILGMAFASVDGVERAYAADLSGTAARATRLGVFHGVVGLAAFVGGIVAGTLWDLAGAGATFAWGTLVPLAALGLLAGFGFIRPWPGRGRRGSPPSPPPPGRPG